MESPCHTEPTRGLHWGGGAPPRLSMECFQTYHMAHTSGLPGALYQLSLVPGSKGMCGPRGLAPGSGRDANVPYKEGLGSTVWLKPPRPPRASLQSLALATAGRIQRAALGACEVRPAIYFYGAGQAGTREPSPYPSTLDPGGKTGGGRGFISPSPPCMSLPCWLVSKWWIQTPLLQMGRPGLRAGIKWGNPFPLLPGLQFLMLTQPSHRRRGITFDLPPTDGQTRAQGDSRSSRGNLP